MKILMVCLGNICRSPMAEGVLAAKLGDGFQVDSAGTGGWHAGQEPDPRSQKAARKRGIELGYQRARKFTKKDFEEFDIIFVMDQSNYRDVIEMAENGEQKKKVRFFLPNEEDLFDPYWSEDDKFDEMFDIINRITDDLAKEFKG